MDDYELKTVGANSDTDLSFADPLLKEQQKQISRMRDTLLSFDKDDIHSAKNAIQSITVMRIYHQVGRIIKFTEMMDRIEDRLYESIDYNLAQVDTMDPQTMMLLLQIQKQLQDTMIESQKLIQPYLNIDFSSIAPVKEVEPNSFGAAVFTQESRSKIRESAQAVLTALTSTDDSSNEETSDTDAVVESSDTPESTVSDSSSELTDSATENPTTEDNEPISTNNGTDSISQAASNVLAELDNISSDPLNNSEVPF